MPRFLDPRGHSTFGIGICARCSKKYHLDELHPDPNSPGLMCCANGCLDRLDPYRLAPRETENITLMYPRPDVQLTPGPTQFPVDQIQAAVANQNFQIIAADEPADEGVAAAPPVTQVDVSHPWAANRYYTLGSSVTPMDPVGIQAVGMVIYTFTCILPGLSGASVPAWNQNVGVAVIDNNVVWLNAGLYSP